MLGLGHSHWDADTIIKISLLLDLSASNTLRWFVKIDKARQGLLIVILMSSDKFFTYNTALRGQIQQLGNLIFYSCKSKFRR